MNSNAKTNIIFSKSVEPVLCCVEGLRLVFDIFSTLIKVDHAFVSQIPKEKKLVSESANLI